MNATDAMGDILFFALGVCLFLFGIILAFCRTVRSKRRCRRRVNAVICDVDVSWTDDDFTDFFIINYKYHPVYQYTLDGQEYRVVIPGRRIPKRTKSKSVVMRCSLWMKRIPGYRFPVPL